MSKNPFTLAICQLRTELVYEQTMQKTEAMVREAAAAGASLVVLPEMFDCPYDREYFHKFTAMGHEDAVRRMAAWAGENKIVLVGGSIPEKDGDRLYNSSFVFGPDGEQLACHRKVHLFDVDLPGMSFRESNTFTPGNRITVVDTPVCRLGVAVCFDVRFPELFRAMAREGAEVIDMLPL